MNNKKTNSKKELALIKKKVILIIKLIYDPEILINIWDIGLIHNIDMLKYNIISIRMTLTSFTCPFYKKIIEEIKSTINITMIEIRFISIEVNWNIKWSKSMINSKTRFILDLI